MKKISIIFIVMLGSFLSVIGKERLDSASAAYLESDYPTAIRIYSEIAENSGVSAPLLANLGNAYVKSGDLGKGLLCFERSLRLDPSDKDVKGNIKYINSKVEDNNRADAKGKKVSVSPEDKGFFFNLRNYIIFRHTSNFWSSWAATFFLLSCICWAAYIFLNEVMIRKIGFFGGIVSFGITIILLVFSFCAAKGAQTSESGIITGYKVSLLSEPYSNAKISTNPLNRGTKMDVLDVEDTGEGKGKWYKVRLNSDYVGWIRSDEFEII